MSKLYAISDMEVIILIILVWWLFGRKKKKKSKRRRNYFGKSEWEKTCDDGGKFFNW